MDSKEYQIKNLKNYAIKQRTMLNNENEENISPIKDSSNNKNNYFVSFPLNNRCENTDDRLLSEYMYAGDVEKSQFTIHKSPLSTNELTHTDDYLKNLELNRVAIEIINKEILNTSEERNCNLFDNLFHYSTEELRKYILIYKKNQKEKMQLLYSQYLGKKEFYTQSLIKRMKLYEKILHCEENKSFVKIMNDQIKKSRKSLKKLEENREINGNRANAFQIILSCVNKIPTTKFDNVDCVYPMENREDKEINENIVKSVYENGQLNIDNLNNSIKCLKETLFYTANQSMNIMIKKSRDSPELPDNYIDRKMFYISTLRRHIKECEQLIDISQHSKEYFVSYYEKKIIQCIEKLGVDDIEIKLCRKNIEELKEQLKLSQF